MKISFKWSSIIIGLALVAGSSSVILFIASGKPPQAIILGKLAEFIPIPIPWAGLPVRLTIESINVDADVEYVGLTSLGAMGAPQGPDGVAWFEQGPRPGNEGSAVIAGHFGWKDGIHAVFDDLSKLRSGDKISIHDRKGGIITFIVREVRVYGENDGAEDVFTSHDGLSHLNLITCQGTWSEGGKSYSNRLVVFSDKEHE